jgi:hypothetical protein
LLTDPYGSQVWWYTPVIPALRSLEEEDCEFKPSLGYITLPCLKSKIKHLHRDSRKTFFMEKNLESEE